MTESLEPAPKISATNTKSVIAPTLGESITNITSGNTYTIGEKIGEGHFGVVYACKDVWLNDLAAKVFKPIGTYEKVRATAEAELRKLISLRNPFITYIYDAFEYRDTFYIVTERCTSPISDLFKIKNFNGPVWLMPIARSILQAVNYLHLNSYVHQDIHAGNVFATLVKNELIPKEANSIQFKLGDLGIAKLQGEIDANNTRAQWMLPPEVLDPAQFGPIDKRIDIYHTGLLFLQLALSKQLEFTEEEILAGKPRQMALSLPSPYNFALEKSLRRHVEFRTVDAMEFWRDLHTPSESLPSPSVK